jgi:endonuclease YncB( thermonuclease family)
VDFLDRSPSYSRLLKKASLAGAFFMSAIWLSSAQALCPAPASLPVAQVQRVVDGDTVRLSDGRSVRMIGLNAPETGKKGQSAQPFAEAAKRRLQALVDESDGQVSVGVGEQATDHYGRTLANLYGRNLVSQFDLASLQRLKGRNVEARGWVVDRSRRGGLKSGQARWMMPITHSAMLNTTSR